jgi:hypothetical protein
MEPSRRGFVKHGGAAHAVYALIFEIGACAIGGRSIMRYVSADGVPGSHRQRRRFSV